MSAQFDDSDCSEFRFESKKALTVVNVNHYVALVDAMNSMDGLDYDVSEPESTIRYATNEEIQVLINERKSQRTESESLAEKKERARVIKIDNEVLQRILNFMKKNTKFNPEIFAIYKENRELSWTDLAEKVGHHFNKSNRTEEADYFYELACEANYEYGPYYDSCSASLSQGYMHLEEFNQEIAAKKSKYPTASMCYHLKKAIFGLNTPSPDEVADFACADLLKIQKMIIRWYLYPEALKADTYYGKSNNLVAKVYAYDFIEWVLKQAEILKIFKNTTCYDGSKSNNDLSKYLIKLGFYGIYQGPGQHNWVHSNGFMVRVKRKENWQAEFTIGITFENPFNWNSNGTPRSLKRHSNSKALIFDEDNEILKLAYVYFSSAYPMTDYDRQSIFVIPAFRAKDWLPYWFDWEQIDSMMKYAHFPLISFGKKTKEDRYDTKKLEKLLTNLS